MPHPYSDVGDANLDRFDAAAGRFTEWMYEHVRPHLGGSILEIGSGTGTYARKVLRDFPGNPITLTDVDERYVARLASLKRDAVRVSQLDLDDPEEIAALDGPFDSAFALNVLEHVKDDERALSGIRQKLRPGGSFVVLVPAHPVLMNRMDEAVGHYRRYSREELKRKAENAGFRVERLYYFNALAIPGWILNGNILGKSEVDETLLGWYDAVVPIARAFENAVLRGSLGISLIAVLRAWPMEAPADGEGKGNAGGASRALRARRHRR